MEGHGDGDGERGVFEGREEGDVDVRGDERRWGGGEERGKGGKGGKMGGGGSKGMMLRELWNGKGRCKSGYRSESMRIKAMKGVGLVLPKVIIQSPLPSSHPSPSQ